ncbi:MAG TPA: permease-like cell division protein FtsX [Candidatus Saccharimonadales bacterium]|nr:permease-like cell division protein FtsX [Candidatus Saccharimonadales bacterium]
MRRKWITMMRVVRYGVSNFSRNAWLTTAATIVMVLTLTIVLATLTSQLVFNDTIKQLRDKIDVSVYLKDDISQDDQKKLEHALKSLPIVTGIDYVSKEEAREKFIQDSKGNIAQLQAIDALDGKNPLPASLRVYVNDTNKLNVINDLLNKDEYANMQAKKASTAGPRREAIENIARGAQFTSIGGLVVSVVFVVISVMIIFNTIRMAIFNRRDEIEIMKLIGAEKSFIRGPFIVEASLYGVIAAFLSTALVYATLSVLTRADIAAYGIKADPTLHVFTAFMPLVILCQIIVGIIIGMISSTLAMRRYLKV